jgi:hypothetical protein
MSYDFHSALAESEVAASQSAYSSNAFASSLTRESSNREGAMRSNVNTGRRVMGDRRSTSSRHVSTKEFTDWVRQQAQNYTEKQLAEITGLSLKAAANLRAGKSGCIGTTLANWCMNDPVFGAAYAEHVGIIPAGHAEFHARVTQAILASQRMHMGGDAE